MYWTPRPAQFQGGRSKPVNLSGRVTVQPFRGAAAAQPRPLRQPLPPTGRRKGG